MKIGVYLTVGLLAASGLLAVACGDYTEAGCDDCAAGGGGQGGSSSGTGGDQGGGGVGGSGGAAGGGGEGGAAPTVCGGIAGETCATSDYCDFQPSTCGGDDSQGLCVPRPEDCPDQALPTCGCDGNVYGNPCEANAAGVDVSTLGGCTPPNPTDFACGPYFCDTATQYCQIFGSDVGGIDHTFECMDLPFCPTQLDCACLATETCGDQCEGDPDIGFTLTCPGG